MICSAGTPWARMRAASLSVSRSPSMTAIRYRSRSATIVASSKAVLPAPGEDMRLIASTPCSSKCSRLCARRPGRWRRADPAARRSRGAGTPAIAPNERFRGSSLQPQVCTWSFFPEYHQAATLAHCGTRSSTRRSRNSSPATIRVRYPPHTRAHQTVRRRLRLRTARRATNDHGRSIRSTARLPPRSSPVRTTANARASNAGSTPDSGPTSM